MRLFFIVDDYLPHSFKIAGKMMHELAVEYQNQGHEITVLTPSPTQKELLVISEIDGVRVLYFKSGRIKNTGKIRRTINESTLSFRAYRAIRNYINNNQHNGILTYSPSIFWGFLVFLLKKKWKCKSYLILRDIFPQWTVDNGILSQWSPIYWFFKIIEKVNYVVSDKIGVMLPSILLYFQKKHYNTSNMEVLYNWSKLEKDTSANGSYRSILGLDEKIVFFYGGNIGRAQNIKNLINLAKKLINYERAHFLFVGKGDDVEFLLKEKEKHNLRNITYLPPVNQTTYFEMLSEFDVGLFSLHQDHKTHNFPGKLLGYMLYSKPLLGCFNKGNDLTQIINENGAGFVVESDDVKGLLESSLKLIESPELIKQMGLNAQNVLKENFSVQSAYNITSRFFSSE